MRHSASMRWPVTSRTNVNPILSKYNTIQYPYRVRSTFKRLLDDFRIPLHCLILIDTQCVESTALAVMRCDVYVRNLSLIPSPKSVSETAGRMNWIFEPYTWWRHQMETFSALLSLCEGNSPVAGEFPSQRQVRRSFDVFFDGWVNNRYAGDLRRHRAHYDVTVCNVWVQQALVSCFLCGRNTQNQIRNIFICHFT